MSEKAENSVRDWWAENPMTYGETHGKTEYTDGSYHLGTKMFFERVDKEFYSWNEPLHHKKPFDQLFPYDSFKNKHVLEIGCGIGTMLMNWAQNGSICTGVDLNPTSIEQTRKRFELFDLKADVHLEDANKLTFPDEQFDYVYSWGVLHHSPNIERSIEELFRVLKPGGQFGIMLYNRKSFYQWYMTDFVEGFLHEEAKYLSPLELNSRYGDGHKEEGNPHTWPVTQKEGVDFIRPFSTDCKARLLGTDLDCVLRMLLPGFSQYLPKAMIKSLARRWGWSLWFYGSKSK